METRIEADSDRDSDGDKANEGGGFRDVLADRVQPTAGGQTGPQHRAPAQGPSTGLQHRALPVFMGVLRARPRRWRRCKVITVWRCKVITV